jgi:hypothetical protein
MNHDEGRASGGTPAACERVRARLVELDDGGLAPLESARDRGHLEACSGCAAAALELARTLTLIRGACQPAEGEIARLIDAVVARLPDGRRPRRVLLAPFRPSLAAAAALLAFVGLGVLGLTPRGLEDFRWRLPRVLSSPELWTLEWSSVLGVEDAGESSR